jgi:N-acetylmuramoyl-L-alanine amidase
MRLKSFLILILMLMFAAIIANGYASAQLTSRSVFIDPFFGGTESGPMVAHKVAAKTMTIDAGLKLKSLLAKNNIEASLSRDRDKLVTLEDRIMIARSRGSNVYVAFKVSKTSKDCIRLYYPPQKQGKPQSGKKIGEAFNDFLVQDKIKRSGALVEALYSGLKQKSVSVCLEKQAGSKQFENDYILENANSPVVIIDFEVSDSASPYVLDSALMEKIISAVSEGIKEYFAASQPKGTLIPS